jgi:hypothetical protein
MLEEHGNVCCLPVLLPTLVRHLFHHQPSASRQRHFRAALVVLLLPLLQPRL